MQQYEDIKIDPDKANIGFLGILLGVQLESFLWGLGTAIGELPPYFVAKKVDLLLSRPPKPGHSSRKWHSKLKDFALKKVFNWKKMSLIF